MKRQRQQVSGKLKAHHFQTIGLFLEGTSTAEVGRARARCELYSESRAYLFLIAASTFLLLRTHSLKTDDCFVFRGAAFGGPTHKPK